MWWECSECGSRVESPRAPTVCGTCDTAGVTFMPVEPLDELDPAAEAQHESWFLDGIAHPELRSPRHPS